MEDETDLLNTYFPKGAEIEISSDEEGFRGAWYEGTVIRHVSKRLKKIHNNNNDDDDDDDNTHPHQQLQVLVEYKTLMSDKKGSKRLQETMQLIQLRPRPPRDPVKKRVVFKVSDEVDAFHNDGWWEGVIMEDLGGGKFSVFFRGTRDQLAFHQSQLRVHREWANGRWTPPFDEEGNVEKLESTETNPSKEAAEKYSEGSLVEVSSDEQGFEGAWFAATVVKLLDNGNYLVEYENLRNDDDTENLKEETDYLHIRPRAPDIEHHEDFKLLEEVDAQYNDGWWVGVISNVLKGQRYKVYFRGNSEELEFNHTDLRPHQDWINGKWVRASEALKL